MLGLFGQLRGERPVLGDTTCRFVDSAIVDLDALGSGHVLRGPTIVEELDTTVLSRAVGRPPPTTTGT